MNSTHRVPPSARLMTNFFRGNWKMFNLCLAPPPSRHHACRYCESLQLFTDIFRCSPLKVWFHWNDMSEAGEEDLQRCILTRKKSENRNWKWKKRVKLEEVGVGNYFIIHRRNYITVSCHSFYIPSTKLADSYVTWVQRVIWIVAQSTRIPFELELKHD